MKRLVLLCCFLFSIAAQAQVKSPEEFLGYPIGSRFTPYHEVIRYFQYITANAGNMVRLEEYGKTNEHRPLYISFISTADNISRLENIRQNNLSFANIGSTATSQKAPAIVWLSYNVHGNESSSTEAAMLTLFALVDPANSKTKEWLKDVVVAIDPCLNPDGRERYINGYNSIVGKHYDPELFSREHQESWPNGRTNHYNFDLNRDWCWQTQVESRARVALYQRWLPQVHVDFHEQGVNQPYYFAPAAEPVHDAVTKWQRDFQVVVGKNNAKYFDKNNWLYFTKEIFDLLYPSYGDTYPLLNGAIGMTYEQGSGGGIGALTDEGDTLTLHDRALHHHTSGLSTIETAAQNSGRLIEEFKKYFNAATKGEVGEFKTYILKNNPEARERMEALKLLLDRNGISYGNSSGNGKGYNYREGREENFTIAASDIIISNAQPKAALVKALFEPKTRLADSVTYDITAWALPYAYGLEAFASRQPFSVKIGKAADTFRNEVKDGYGYVIRWQGVASSRATAALLQKNIRLRYSEVPFDAGGRSFDRGSIIILKKGNEKFGNSLWQTIAEVCNQNNVEMFPVSSGMVEKGFDFGSYYVHQLKAPKVVLLTGEEVNANAAGEVWNFLENELDYPVSLVNAGDFESLNLSKTDVLILPDGRYPSLGGKESSDKLKVWIQGGGKLIALEGAAAMISKQDWSAVHARSSTDSTIVVPRDSYELLQRYGHRERSAIASNTFGSIFKVDIDNSHPLMFGYPAHYFTLKLDNTVFDFIKDGGWNTGVIKKSSQVAGFVGYKVNFKLKDGLLFGVQQLGSGSVVFMADNVLFRNFWENGKLMFSNAIFMVGK